MSKKAVDLEALLANLSVDELIAAGFEEMAARDILRNTWPQILAAVNAGELKATQKQGRYLFYVEDVRQYFDKLKAHKAGEDEGVEWLTIDEPNEPDLTPNPKTGFIEI